MRYDFAAIEKKWQDRWEESKPYAAVTDGDKPKFYGLIEFPYPSGQPVCMSAIRVPLRRWTSSRAKSAWRATTSSSR